MKNLKVLLVFAVMGLFIGVTAFSDNAKKQVKEDPVWFVYDPINQNGTLDPDNYFETPMGPECSDELGSFCSVFAEPDPTSGDVGERKPLPGSLSEISGTYSGFDNYVEGVIHLRD